MGHGYRSALSNWLRGRRRPREDKHKEASQARVPPPPPPGYESDDSRAPTWVSSGPASEMGAEMEVEPAAGLGSARGRRSVSDSAVLEATQSTMRHMRSFAAVDGASHMGGPRASSKHRRSSWVPSSWQEGAPRAEMSASAPAAAAPTPIYHHAETRPSVRRFHLSRRISRRLSRPHLHHDAAGSPEAVALTPGPSIIFIEC